MAKIAIVDDDNGAVENLTSLLLRYTGETGIVFEIKAFSDGESFLAEPSTDYDLLFLDIQLPHQSGLEVAGELRKKNPSLPIIFETEFGQYALFGYKVNALDYFVKPVSYYELKMRLMLFSFNTKNVPSPILVHVKGGIQTIFECDLLYVEQVGHTQIFHTEKGEFETTKRRSLSKLEKSLSSQGFARCNSSFLLNLRRCTSLSHDSIFMNELEFKISRGMRRNFITRLSESFKIGELGAKETLCSR